MPWCRTRFSKPRLNCCTEIGKSDSNHAGERRTALPKWRMHLTFQHFSGVHLFRTVRKASSSAPLTIFESFRISFISFAFCTSLLVFVCIISGMAVMFSFAAIWQFQWATRREIEDFDKKGFPVRTKQCMCSTKEPLDWTGYFVCTIHIGEESSLQSSHSLIIVQLLLFLSNRSTHHAPNQRSYAREQKTLQNEPVNRVL